MSSAVAADVKRYFRRRHQGQRFALLKVFPTQFGLHALLVYRFGKLLLNLRAPWWWPILPPGWALYAIGAFWVRRGYGIHLHLSADIGPGLYIGHLGGIWIRNCSLGAHCSIGQQTRICGVDKSGPQLGDRVWVGSHASLSGDIRIGEGATIGAGTHVTNEVPSRALVVGRPGRVIQHGFDNSALF